MVRLIGKVVAMAVLVSLCAVGQAAPASKPAGKRSHASRSKKPAAIKETPPPQPVAIPAMTPEQLPPEAPRVTYSNGLLTVDSQNATLGEIFGAIRRQTGLQLDSIAGFGSERVAAHFAGAPRDVISGLLDGSKYGYVLVGSATDAGAVQKVVLTTLAPGGASPPTQTAANQRPTPPPPQVFTPPPDYSPDVEEEPDAVSDRNPPPEQPPQPGMPGQPGVTQPGMPQATPGQPNPYTGGEQPRFGQPPQTVPGQQNPDQPQIKTPDQLLQELQRLRQRQQNPQNPPQQ